MSKEMTSVLGTYNRPLYNKNALTLFAVLLCFFLVFLMGYQKQRLSFFVSEVDLVLSDLRYGSRDIAQKALVKGFHKFKKNKVKQVELVEEGLRSSDYFIRRSAVSLVYLNLFKKEEKLEFLERATFRELQLLKQEHSRQVEFNLQQDLYYLYRLGKESVPTLKKVLLKVTDPKARLVTEKYLSYYSNLLNQINKPLPTKVIK
jgi:hypothetical protein